MSASRKDRRHLERMSLNCSNEFKIFGGIVVWSVKTGELNVLAVALKCETLYALSVHVSARNNAVLLSARS